MWRKGRKRQYRAHFPKDLRIFILRLKEAYPFLGRIPITAGLRRHPYFRGLNLNYHLTGNYLYRQGIKVRGNGRTLSVREKQRRIDLVASFEFYYKVQEPERLPKFKHDRGASLTNKSRENLCPCCDLYIGKRKFMKYFYAGDSHHVNVCAGCLKRIKIVAERSKK